MSIRIDPTLMHELKEFGAVGIEKCFNCGNCTAICPLTSDDSTSVRLMGGDGHWLATHDCQPALGAVPTLKWIRGSRVVDRHLLPIPEDFTGGEVRATLVAYERFRMTALPSMDTRFKEVPLGDWTLP